MPFGLCADTRTWNVGQKMKSAFEEFKEARNQLISSFAEGEVSNDFPENYTEITDQYFRRSLQESKVGHSLFRKRAFFALVAVGGYGRRELCLHSDIDILILFGPKIPTNAKELTKEILYPLWDLGLDVGHAIRSIKDCLSLCKDDFEVLTSVMDARFICGDSPLYLGLMESFQKKVVSKKAIAFSGWLEDREIMRMETYGDASHLLEPNLKEGIGGLRDYHHMLWLARAFFNLRVPRDLEYTGKLSFDEYQDLRKNLKLIWLVRNHLHQVSGRKNDRMGFEFQEKIALRLGFHEKNGLLGVEQFLGILHASMTSIKTLHRSFALTHVPKRKKSKNNYEAGHILVGLNVYKDEINFDSAMQILSNPFLLINIFEWSCRLNFPLSTEARRLVREFVYLVDDVFRKSGTAVHGFLDILKEKSTVKTLDQMFETGFLDAFIPEFGKIKNLVQFDAYHIFPVGRHVLESIKHLKHVANQKDLLLADIFSDLSNPEVLFLAALFHDIGKTGKEHARKGVAISRDILKRFGYNKKGTEDILFLIGNHLLLVETATRRDLNDEKAVIHCARTIGHVERLKMLYLLTWADSRATGPKAWNDWIANMVQELFFKIMHILEKKDLATPDASQKAENTKSEVRSLMADRMEWTDLNYLFEAMSPRYLLSTNPNYIVNHLSMVQQLKEELEDIKSHGFVFEAKEDEWGSCWEVTFLAKDRPGLFSDLAGVLTLNNINILSADIYTWRDGTVVDIFRVTSPLDPIHPDKTWERVKRDLKNTFTGKLSLDYRLSQKTAPYILSYLKKPSRPPKVTVDNESSDFFTLIEVFADDRLGLLYMITHTLFNLKLDIRIAKIATKTDQIADVFYVRDLGGQKVEDNEQIEEINQTLIHQLKQG